MSVQDFVLPDLGEGLTEGEIISWRVAVGDQISLNDPLVEVETAKAAVEIPSPFSGRVSEILVDAGAAVDVGQLIVRIEDDAPEREPLLVGYGVSTERRRRRERAAAAPAATVAHSNSRPRTKPPLRKFARDHAVDLSEISGTGPDGIITRADILAVCDEQPAGSGDRRSAVRGIRSATAQAMVRSAAIPQVTVFHSVDVTAAVELLDHLRALPEFAEVKISPLLLVARAVIRTCRAHPGINASWEDGEVANIVQHESVHLGIAADTERGLIVPNIKFADQLSLVDLATALQTLTDTARAGKHTPADLTGGTITITNVGVFGVDVGAPLLNPGEGAILCAGAIADRPWVHDGALAVRKVLHIALTVDHRIIDGGLASRALAEVGAGLTDPLRLLLT